MQAQKIVQLEAQNAQLEQQVVFGYIFLLNPIFSNQKILC